MRSPARASFGTLVSGLSGMAAGSARPTTVPAGRTKLPLLSASPRSRSISLRPMEPRSLSTLPPRTSSISFQLLSTSSSTSPCRFLRILPTLVRKAFLTSDRLASSSRRQRLKSISDLFSKYSSRRLIWKRLILSERTVMRSCLMFRRRNARR